ncbi:adhesion protein FadA [Sebaldella sp. S0638]|uniref:adhesion protein FadA n=1 Tax=Sebaldella sp. S0638 TaxID=2957809 RepID=UPI00209E555E|nr:adhesion protein FadA [Sebaldella sp. S0638]MCP1225025.1 adhesion protein FadA [Sebaldella sp. S0638]
MKRILLCLLLGTMCFGYTRMSTLTEEAGKLNSAETGRQKRLVQRKEKLENDLSKLYENYNSRTEITEKLRMDSEVRWYRDEYREILKKYDDVQKNLSEEINKKEKELALVNIGLGIQEEAVLED